MLGSILYTALCAWSAGDSLLLTPVDTVFINKTRADFASVGRLKVRISNNNQAQTLTDVMGTTGTFFKQYGPAGSATISKRGADASQTQVIWNGLPINHPMLGMMDFNNISAIGNDEMYIIEGGNSSMFGSGSVGGIVVLNNQPNFTKKVAAQINSGINSISNYRNSADVKVSNEKWYWNIDLSSIYNFNRFNYFENGKTILWDKTKFYQNTFKNTLAHKINKQDQFKWSTDLGEVYREIGNSTLAEQSDFYLRSVLDYNKIFGEFQINQKIGYTYDRIAYADAPIFKLIPDSSFATMYFSQTELSWQNSLGNALLGFDYQRQEGKSAHYFKDATRNLPAAFIAWMTELKNAKIAFDSRYEINGGFWSGAFNIESHLMEDLKSRFNVNKSFRRPTLNDLYWVNTSSEFPQLLNESGWSTEIGLDYFLKVGNNTILPSVTIYYRELSNPISWQPKPNGLWRPMNLHYGTYNGLQIGLDWGIIRKYSTWNFNYKSEWVNAWVIKKDNIGTGDVSRPIFIPDWTHNAKFSWNCGNISLHSVYHYRGSRFITSDNSDWLNSYSIVDFGGSYQVKLAPKSKYIILLGIDIQNALNEQYQNMPGRPMPTRSISINCTIKFNR